MRLIISSAGSQHIKAGAMHMHMCLCMHMLQGRSFIDPSVRKRGTNVGAGTDTRPRGSSLQGLPRLTMRLPEDRTNIVVNHEGRAQVQCAVHPSFLLGSDRCACCGRIGGSGHTSIGESESDRV